MSEQVALTIVAPIKRGQREKLEQQLESIGDDPANNPLLPFGRLAGVHFARLVVLEETTDLRGEPIDAQLVFASDVDAPLDRHLGELVDVAGPGLDQIFGYCEGYPSDGSPPRAARLAYLRGRMVQASTSYVNTIGRSVQQVRQEAQLREAIQDFLDRSGQDWCGRSALEVRAAIRDFVAGEPSLSWARRPAERPGPLWRLKELAHLVAVPLGLLLVSPLLLLALPFWAILLRIHELTDSSPHLKPDDAWVQRLAALEDHTAQNQFSALGYLKPGPFRRLTALAVLFLASYAVRHVFNDGILAGVKTIHFARWVFLDGKRRLIFMSNYDGSLESYMDDFIDKVAWGLNAVFSNGFGFPRTRWLVLDGARDELAFKDFLRRHQLPTQVWYAAYDQLTALNIGNNARIRAGLYGKMSEAEAAAWLGRL